jgi:LPXTG-motif cell wall-anchored protein
MSLPSQGRRVGLALLLVGVLLLGGSAVSLAAGFSSSWTRDLERGDLKEQVRDATAAVSAEAAADLQEGAGAAASAQAATSTPVHSGGNALSPASAPPDPPGNNGTVKVDGVDFDDHPNNEPHPGCIFQLDFYNYDEGVGDASWSLELQPPTTGTSSDFLESGTVNNDTDPAGGGTDVDGSANPDIALELLNSGATPHPQQGYHVKLTVNAPGSIGADVKHKVFWVECAPQATIVVKKLISSGSNQAQTFTFSASTNAAGLAGTYTHNTTDSIPVTTQGAYTATEALPGGWNNPSISCVGDPSSDSSGSGLTATFNVSNADIAAGATTTCTFTNSQPSQGSQFATIIIEKQADDDATESFNFSGAIAANLTDGQTASATVPVGGPYVVTENLSGAQATAGWDLVNVTCDNAKGTGDPTAGTATFSNLANGDVVKCTFFNDQPSVVVQPGRIVVVKQTIPNGANAEFNFSGALTTTLGDGESASLEVAPGTYTVTEADKAGWKLKDVDCDDADSSRQGSSANFVVAEGETVTCTFFNKVETVVLPKPPIVQPGNPEPEVLPKRVLPLTGGDPSGLVAAAGLLMAAGGAALTFGRSRKRDDDI